MPRRTPTPLGPVLGTVLSAGMLLLTGCVTAPDDVDGGQEVNTATMEQDSYGQGPTEPDERVFGDRESWGPFWQEHAARKGGTAIAATPPQVDFDSEFVVFVYAGQKSSGGHAIELTNMTFDGESYAAMVTEHEPGDDCVTTDALTYPYHLVRVTRADGDPGGTPDVTFDHETNTYSC